MIFNEGEEKQTSPVRAMAMAGYIIVVGLGLFLLFEDALSFPTPIASSLAVFIALKTAYPINIKGKKNGFTKDKRDWSFLSWGLFSLIIATFDFVITFFLF